MIRGPLPGSCGGALALLRFTLPAGVIIDAADLRKLIARADLLRAAIVIAMLTLTLAAPCPGAVWLLAGAVFLFGAAEGLRDHAAQTVLPAIVPAGDLERANRQLWSSEQLTGPFIGPPLAGLPFSVDAALLILAAGLVWMMSPPACVPGPGFAAR